MGQIEAALVAAHVSYELVTPQVWQRALGIKAVKNETKSKKKNRHKELAQSLFPGHDVTLKNVDALLILEHGRRVMRGEAA